MEPKVLSRASFVVAGLPARITPDVDNTDHYGTIWKEFEAIHARIQPHSTDQAYYGVSFPTAEEGVLDYVAGMAVVEGAELPENVVICEIAAAHYAVFECPLHAIGDSYRYIFTEWLQPSPYEISSAAPVFEQYPPAGQEHAPVLIHIPIEQGE
jgi:predicted transcriptional regulator YdeE